MADYEDFSGLKNTFADRMKLFDNMSVKEVVETQAEARATADRLKAEAVAAKAYYDFISIFVLPSKMEDAGLENARFEGIGRVSLRGDMQCSTKKGQGPVLLQWLEEHDHEDLIKPGVNPSTLKAFIKEQLEAGKEIPDELLNLYPYTRAVITKN